MRGNIVYVTPNNELTSYNTDIFGPFILIINYQKLLYYNKLKKFCQHYVCTLLTYLLQFSVFKNVTIFFYSNKNGLVLFCLLPHILIT